VLSGGREKLVPVSGPFVAAYGQDLMTADTQALRLLIDVPHAYAVARMSASECSPLRTPMLSAQC
jgi:hypothetical protein